MSGSLNFIVNIIITGISGILCLFLFKMAQISDIYWDYIKEVLKENG